MYNNQCIIIKAVFPIEHSLFLRFFVKIIKFLHFW